MGEIEKAFLFDEAQKVAPKNAGYDGGLDGLSDLLKL